MKKLKYQLVKIHQSYSLKEIADLFEVHIRTVQKWRKNGMKVIEENSIPYLVEGYILKEFVKQRMASRKCKLKDNEFYCIKCRQSRKGIKDQFDIIETNKVIGKNEKQIIISGVCEECGTQLNRFSTETKIKDLIDKGMTFTERGLILMDNTYNFLNTDIGRVKK